jgi:(1->4)-alpha-D-glucan 1-alpha-D-glucosylmutase
VHGGEARRLRRAYTKLTGESEPFEDVLYESKRLIMSTAMASELNVLAHALERLAGASRRSRDFTLDSLRDTITETVACFPVYRTYVDECGWTPGDRAVVERAINRARRRNPAMEASLFDFLREVLMPRPISGDDVRPDDRRDGYPPADVEDAKMRLHFAMKFQQYTGPVHAKGLEDTAFFRYNVLLSLNEVGGDAERIGRPVEAFHAANARRLSEHPHEMLATATHDTKLGEDTRARINVISELPDLWSREYVRWRRINAAQKRMVDGEPAPDRNDEYRFYQALVGIWPIDPDRLKPAPALEPDMVERLKAYMIKSVKEAKRHTSWLTPHEEYEAAVAAFVERTLTGPSSMKFVTMFAPFAERIAQVGMINSLAQLVLKIGSPGVPDFYQGTELWDLSLVDPDNRRAVDFELRTQLLDGVEEILAMQDGARTEAVSRIVQNWQDGRIKMLVTAVGLRLRQERPDLFLRGRYLPLPTEAAVSSDIVAFARVEHETNDRAVLFVAPRLVAPISTNEKPVPLGGDAWKTSRILLPPELRSRTFTNIVTGERLECASTAEESWLFAGQVFSVAPVAILTAD